MHQFLLPTSSNQIPHPIESMTVFVDLRSAIVIRTVSTVGRVKLYELVWSKTIVFHMNFGTEVRQRLRKAEQSTAVRITEKIGLHYGISHGQAITTYSLILPGRTSRVLLQCYSMRYCMTSWLKHSHGSERLLWTGRQGGAEGQPVKST